MRAYKHRPKPPHNGNRPQRDKKFESIAKSCQIFTEQEAINKLKAECTAEGR